MSLSIVKKMYFLFLNFMDFVISLFGMNMAWDFATMVPILYSGECAPWKFMLVIKASFYLISRQNYDVQSEEVSHADPRCVWFMSRFLELWLWEEVVWFLTFKRWIKHQKGFLETIMHFKTNLADFSLETHQTKSVRHILWPKSLRNCLNLKTDVQG